MSLSTTLIVAAVALALAGSAVIAFHQCSASSSSGRPGESPITPRETEFVGEWRWEHGGQELVLSLRLERRFSFFVAGVSDERARGTWRGAEDGVTLNTAYSAGEEPIWLSLAQLRDGEAPGRLRALVPDR